MSRLQALVFGVVLTACGALLCFTQYRPTLSFGFHYDDYHFVRPYEWREAAAAFRGPWDPLGIEVPFYRPLTIVFFAIRFHVLRMDATAYHVLSVALFTLLCVAGALFTRIVVGTVSAAIWFAIFWAVHPAFPASLAAWITNQMHLLEACLVFGALLYWWSIRRRAAVWWLPLLLAQTAVFLVKEDGILLLPFIALSHEAHRRLVDPPCPLLSLGSSR